MAGSLLLFFIVINFFLVIKFILIKVFRFLQERIEVVLAEGLFVYPINPLVVIEPVKAALDDATWGFCVHDIH